MAERVPARLTAAQGRRFGLTVGLAFLVLAGIAWWRGHPTSVLVLGSLGTLLVLVSVVAITTTKKTGARVQDRSRGQLIENTGEQPV